MSGQTWTPAPKRGAIPLHPMTFGVLLGRAFSALRHNPKVLFGFAAAVQFGIVIVTALLMLVVVGFTTARIASVPPGSPDYGPIVAGSIALGGLAGVVLALASVAFTAVVQGLVAADVSFAALSRKATLRMLWRKVRPAFWRLFALWALQAVAVLLWIAIGFGIVFGLLATLGFDNGGAIALAVGIGLILLLGMIPLYLWLSTKLLVVPSVLVLERATLRAALVRSWRLTRGRFWPALGVIFLINLILGAAAQVVSIPGTFIAGLVGGIVSPTDGDAATAAVILIGVTILSQALVLAVGAIQLVVQGTGATLIYLDCRMRYEGLDQALIRYVERSALGTPDEELGDPYAVDPARAVSSAPPPKPAPVNNGYPAQQPYPAQPGYGTPPAQPGYGAPPAAPAGAGPDQAYSAPSTAVGQPPYAQYAPPQTAPFQPSAPAADPASRTNPPAPAAKPEVMPPASTSPWAPPGGDA